MSRETLDDEHTLAPAATDGPVTVLDVGAVDGGKIEVESGGTVDPAPPPAAGPRRPTAAVVRACAATALVVGFAGAVSVVAVGASSDPDRTEPPTLVGQFTGYGTGEPSDGPVRFEGALQVVNPGALTVEVVQVDVWGAVGEPLERPVEVEPGRTASVAVSGVIACGLQDDSVVVRGVVVDDDGIRSDPAVVELQPFDPGAMTGPETSGLCGGLGLPEVAVSDARLGSDGRLVVDVVSRSDRTSTVEISVGFGSGLALTADSTAVVELTDRGRGRLDVGLVVEDCEQALPGLGRGYDVLQLLHQSGNGITTGLLGWDPAASGAAVGFAVARDCG